MKKLLLVTSMFALCSNISAQQIKWDSADTGHWVRTSDTAAMLQAYHDAYYDNRSEADPIYASHPQPDLVTPSEAATVLEEAAPIGTPTYTKFVLLLLGLSGVLLHHLIKMDEINRRGNGTLNFRSYFMLERFSFLISLITISVASYLLDRELSVYLNTIGWFKYFLGCFMVVVGYMGQSLLVKYMGKAGDFFKADADKR